jgi:hypothetical protein
MDPSFVSIRGLNFPMFGRGFDSHRPLHKSAKSPLIRLPLLTGHPSICAYRAVVLRPFCAQLSDEGGQA